MVKYYLNINEDNRIILSSDNTNTLIMDLKKINKFMSNLAGYPVVILEENQDYIVYEIDNVKISVNKNVVDFFNSYLAAYRILNILPKTIEEINSKNILDLDENKMIKIIIADLNTALMKGNVKKIKELTTVLKKKNSQLVKDYNIKLKVNREKSIDGIVIKSSILLLAISIFTVSIINAINNSNKNDNDNINIISSQPSYITDDSSNYPYLSTPYPVIEPEINHPVSELPQDLWSYYYGENNYNPYEYIEPTAAPYDSNTNQNIPIFPEVTPTPTVTTLPEETPTPYIPKVIDGGVSYVNIPGLQDASWTDKFAFVKKNYGSTFEKYAKITGNSSAIMMALATQEKGYHEPIRDPYGDIGICQINPDIWLKKDSQGNYYVSEDYYDFSENKWKNFLFDENIYNEEENIFASNIIFHNCLNEFKGNIVAALFAYNWGPTATKEKLMQISSEYGMDYDEFLTNTPDYRWIDAFNEEVIGENGTTMVVNYALLVLRYLPQNTPILCNINGDDGNIYAKVYSVAPALTKDSERFVFN